MMQERNQFKQELRQMDLDTSGTMNLNEANQGQRESTRMRSVTVCGLALGLSAAIATNANALTISDDDSFANITTELMNQRLSVDLFDDMGGTRTLNSVFVQVAGDISADGSVTNTAAQAQTFQFSETAELFQGTASGPASLQTLDLVPVFGGTLIGQDTYVNLGSGASDAFGPFDINGSADFLLTTAADIAQFVGVGTFSYDFNTIIGQAFAGGGGNIIADVTTLAGATLTVTYDFDEDEPPVQVTEPGTLILMGAGFIGMVGFRRRLRQS